MAARACHRTARRSRGHAGPGLRLRRGQPAVPRRRRVGRRRGAGHHVPPAAERRLRRAVEPDPAGLRRRPRRERRGPAVRLPHRRGRGHRAARPARGARCHPGPGAPPGHGGGPAASRPVRAASHRPRPRRRWPRPASRSARILAGPVSPGPPGGIPGLAGAFPLPNAAGLLARDNEQSTTVITFLYFRPGTSFGAQTAARTPTCAGT